MMKNEFKPGDLVFEMSFIHGIALTELTAFEHPTYSVRGRLGTYAANGRNFEDRKLPSLLPATPEMREKLVAIWGEDAVPELPPRGSELTKAMLKEQDYVLCWVSDGSDSDARENKEIVVIDYMDANEIYFVSIGSNAYGCAVPIDMNGNEITEVE